MAKKKPLATSVIPDERIERAILLVRGQKVLLDKDLAALYGVATKVLNQAVRRNLSRFPADFMFQLTKEELKDWRSQFVTSNSAAKMGLRRAPYAFTEQGVAMLSSVLNSERAVAVNIEIMRAFVRLRQMLASHADLARRLDELEKKYDAQFRAVFDAIRQLMAPPAEEPRDRIPHAGPARELMPEIQKRRRVARAPQRLETSTDYAEQRRFKSSLCLLRPSASSADRGLLPWLCRGRHLLRVLRALLFQINKVERQPRITRMAPIIRVIS